MSNPKSHHVSWNCRSSPPNTNNQHTTLLCMRLLLSIHVLVHSLSTLHNLMQFSISYEGHYTHESLRALDVQYKIMWLVKKLDMVQLHFTLDHEGLMDQRCSNEWKAYMASYMALSEQCFKVYLMVPRLNKNRWIQHKIRGCGKQVTFHWFPNILYCHGEVSQLYLLLLDYP